MYRFLAQFAEPYTLCLLLACAGLAGLWRRRDTPRRPLLATLPLALLVLASLHPVAHLLLGTLEWHYPPADGRPAALDAVVVLDGGALFPDGVRRHVELSPSSVHRAGQAARLYHDGDPCPVIVTGPGKTPGGAGPTAAAAVQDFLTALGVAPADVIREEDSRTTHENAVRCACLIRERGFRRVALVTEATHMFRAVRCFQNQGVDVAPSPCGHLATEVEWSPDKFLPSFAALGLTQRAAHEWLGLAYYRLRGRI